MENKPTPINILKCSCGFIASQAEYLRMHLAEGNCTPTEAHCVLIRQRMLAIARELESAAIRAALLNSENSQLHQLLQIAERPIIQKPKTRRCVICKKETMNKFGGRVQCAYHVAGGNVRSAAILEELLHGDD